MSTNAQAKAYAARIVELEAKLAEAQAVGVEDHLAHEELVAAVEKQRDEALTKLAEAKEMSNTWHIRAAAHRQAKELAEAEVERLRSVLREVECWSATDLKEHGPGPLDGYALRLEVIRAALRGGGE